MCSNGQTFLARRAFPSDRPARYPLQARCYNPRNHLSPREDSMKYSRISADCHLDLPWMPPDLFTSSASAALKSRMPYVTDGPDGPHWTCKNGGSFGLLNGVGPAGAKYIPGQHHRVDIMAGTGLYDDGKKGIR